MKNQTMKTIVINIVKGKQIVRQKGTEDMMADIAVLVDILPVMILVLIERIYRKEPEGETLMMIATTSSTTINVASMKVQGSLEGVVTLKTPEEMEIALHLMKGSQDQLDE